MFASINKYFLKHTNLVKSVHSNHYDREAEITLKQTDNCYNGKKKMIHKA